LRHDERQSRALAVPREGVEVSVAAGQTDNRSGGEVDRNYIGCETVDFRVTLNPAST
jgi:hypothetical protein